MLRVDQGVGGRKPAVPQRVKTAKRTGEQNEGKSERGRDGVTD